MDRAWRIYALVDPRNGATRYVGKTVEPKKRLDKHMSEARAGKRRSHRSYWLRELLSCGLFPTETVLEEGIGLGWQGAEKKWIRLFREAGVNLVNGTDGGEGREGIVVSAETRAKLAAFRLGKHLSPEAKAKLSALHKGIPLSAETKAKLSAVRRGRKRKPLSAEHRAKIAAAHRGKKLRPLSAETKAKLSAINRGKTLSLEHRAKIGAANRGKIRSPETCARISIAKRRIASQAVVAVGENGKSPSA